MGVTNFVCAGRRIMPPEERDALAADEGHSADMAIGADSGTYRPGPRGQSEIMPGTGRVLIVFTRFWSDPRWAFVTEARNRYGDVLATTTRETFKEARIILEDTLRVQKIIS